MADRVRYNMDRMAGVLRQLEDADLFSKDEIKMIVKKRTDYEYMMMRFELKVEDLQSYLTYEENLEQLLGIRMKKQLDLPKKDKNIVNVHRSIRVEFIKHVNYIYVRGTRKFSDNFDLYMQYLRYLQKKEATHLLDEAFGNAIALHPKQSLFYTQAALHEINAHQNIFAARVLLQRGLRACAQNQHHVELWKTYLNLEIWNYLRAIERYRALGLIEVKENLSKTKDLQPTSDDKVQENNIDDVANKLSVYNINKEPVETNIGTLEKPIEVLLKYATRQLLSNGHSGEVFDMLLQLSPVSLNLYTYSLDQVQTFFLNCRDKAIQLAYLSHQCKMVFYRNLVHSNVNDFTMAAETLVTIVKEVSSLLHKQNDSLADSEMRLSISKLFHCAVITLISVTQYLTKRKEKTDENEEATTNNVINQKIIDDIISKYFMKLNGDKVENTAEKMLLTANTLTLSEEMKREIVSSLYKLLDSFASVPLSEHKAQIDQSVIKDAANESEYLYVTYLAGQAVEKLVTFLHPSLAQSSSTLTKKSKGTKDANSQSEPSILATLSTAPDFVEIINQRLDDVYLPLSTRILSSIHSNNLHVIQMFGDNSIYYYIDSIAALIGATEATATASTRGWLALLETLAIFFMLSNDSFDKIVIQNAELVKIMQSNYSVQLQQFFSLLSRITVKHDQLRAVAEKALVFYLHNSALTKQEYQTLYFFIMQNMKKKYSAVFREVNLVAVYSMILEVQELLEKDDKKRGFLCGTFYISILQAASSDCPEHASFTEKLIEAYHKAGQHDKANHLQFVKRRKLQN